MALFQEISTNPLVTLALWQAEALDKNLPEPTSMSLATVDKGHSPAVRVVLCKKIDIDRGIFFFTNYMSRKSQELLASPKVAVNFFWAALARQVRIDGSVVKLPRAESEAYFATRPRESQIGAWASPQSEVIKDFEWLQNRVERYQSEFSPDKPIPCPPHWGGFLIAPHQIEFWEGKLGRLHDRVQLTRGTDQSLWERKQLAP